METSTRSYRSNVVTSLIALALFLALSSTLVLSAPLDSDSGDNEWNMLQRHVNHSGYTNSSSPANIVTSFLDSNDVDALSGMAVNRDFVYFGGVNNSMGLSRSLYQLNASDIHQSIAEFNKSGPISSTPALTDDYVYVGSNDTKVYQLNASNVSKEIANFSTEGGISASPAVSNGNVYIGSTDNKLYQLNASNVSDNITDFEAGDNINSSAAVGNGFVYVGSTDKRLYQLNASNVSIEISNFSTNGPILSSPTITDEYVYVGSDDNTIYQLNASNVSENISSFETGGRVRGELAIYNGYLYVGSNDGSVYQLNASNISNEIANFTTLSLANVTAPPVIAGDDVYVGAENDTDARIYQLSASNISNMRSEMRNFSTNRTSLNSLKPLAVSHGVLYMGDETSLYRVGNYNITGKSATLEFNDSLDYSSSNSTIVTGDVDGDNVTETVAGTSKGIMVVSYNGSSLAVEANHSLGLNCSDCLGISTEPLLADIDRDGDIEIVAGAYDDNTTYVFRHNGSGITEEASLQLDGRIYSSSPVTDDIDDDNTWEIIMGDADDSIHILNHDGSSLSEEASFSMGGMLADPVLADPDGDNTTEIVAASLNKNLYVLEYDGSSISEEDSFNTTNILEFEPVVSDVDDDNSQEIVLDRWNVSIFNHSGSQLREEGFFDKGCPVTTGVLNPRCMKQNGSSLATADFDGDNDTEIFTGGSTEVHLLRHNGSDIREVDSMSVENPVMSEPLVVDVDGDNITEAVFKDQEGIMYVFSKSSPIQMEHRNDLERSGTIRAIDEGTVVDRSSGGGLEFGAFSLYYYIKHLPTMVAIILMSITVLACLTLVLSMFLPKRFHRFASLRVLRYGSVTVLFVSLAGVGVYAASSIGSSAISDYSDAAACGDITGSGSFALVATNGERINLKTEPAPIPGDCGDVVPIPPGDGNGGNGNTGNPNQGQQGNGGVTTGGGISAKSAVVSGEIFRERPPQFRGLTTQTLKVEVANCRPGNEYLFEFADPRHAAITDVERGGGIRGLGGCKFTLSLIARPIGILGLQEIQLVVSEKREEFVQEVDRPSVPVRDKPGIFSISRSGTMPTRGRWFGFKVHGFMPEDMGLRLTNAGGLPISVEEVDAESITSGEKTELGESEDLIEKAVEYIDDWTRKVWLRIPEDYGGSQQLDLELMSEDTPIHRFRQAVHVPQNSFIQATSIRPEVERDRAAIFGFGSGGGGGNWMKFLFNPSNHCLNELGDEECAQQFKESLEEFGLDENIDISSSTPGSLTISFGGTSTRNFLSGGIGACISGANRYIGKVCIYEKGRQESLKEAKKECRNSFDSREDQNECIEAASQAHDLISNWGAFRHCEEEVNSIEDACNCLPKEMFERCKSRHPGELSVELSDIPRSFAISDRGSRQVAFKPSNLKYMFARENSEKGTMDIILATSDKSVTFRNVGINYDSIYALDITPVPDNCNANCKADDDYTRGQCSQRELGGDWVKKPSLGDCAGNKECYCKEKTSKTSSAPAPEDATETLVSLIGRKEYTQDWQEYTVSTELCRSSPAKCLTGIFDSLGLSDSVRIQRSSALDAKVSVGGESYSFNPSKLETVFMNNDRSRIILLADRSVSIDLSEVAVGELNIPEDPFETRLSGFDIGIRNRGGREVSVNADMLFTLKSEDSIMKWIVEDRSSLPSAEVAPTFLDSIFNAVGNGIRTVGKNTRRMFGNLFDLVSFD